MYTILRDKNEGLSEEMLGFAQALVKTPSPSLGEGRVAGLVHEQMLALGYDRVHRDDAGNVVGLLLGLDAAPTVVLNSHMDTVGVPDLAAGQVRHPDGTLADGQLWGSGAADCKGGLAAQVYAGALLRRSLLPLRGNLVVAATVAEENGRSVGVRQLLQRTLPDLGLTPDYAVLGEPTGLNLYYGHDGWLEAALRVESADPFTLDDAVRSICRELSGEGASRAPRETAPLVVGQPVFEDGAGTRRALIRVSKRLLPGEAADAALKALRHDARMVTSPAAALAVDVQVAEDEQHLYTGRTTLVRHVCNAWTTDPFCPLVNRARQALAAAGCVARSGRWELGRLGMGTAGSLFLGEFDIPTIGYGPGDEEQAHRADEHVATANLVEAVYGTAALVYSLVGIPVCGWTSDEI